MLDLRINKPLLFQIDSELTKEHKAKLAMFLFYFGDLLKKSNISNIVQPITYRKVDEIKEKLECFIEKNENIHESSEDKLNMSVKQFNL